MLAVFISKTKTILKFIRHHNDHTHFFISWLAFRLLLSVVTKALLFSSIFFVTILWINLRFLYSSVVLRIIPQTAHLILVPEPMRNYFFATAFWSFYDVD